MEASAPRLHSAKVRVAGFLIGADLHRRARSGGSIRTRRARREPAAYEANLTTRSKYATTPPMRTTDQTSSSSSV
jgi:hypothetical protein